MFWITCLRLLIIYNTTACIQNIRHQQATMLCVVSGCVNGALLQCCAKRVADAVTIYYADMMSNDVIGTQRLLSSNKCIKQKYLVVYHSKTTLSVCHQLSISHLCHRLDERYAMLIFSGFYPRDAMLTRVFATATCPSVRLSVTRRYCD